MYLRDYPSEQVIDLLSLQVFESISQWAGNWFTIPAGIWEYISANMYLRDYPCTMFTNPEAAALLYWLFTTVPDYFVWLHFSITYYLIHLLTIYWTRLVKHLHWTGWEITNICFSNSNQTLYMHMQARVGHLSPYSLHTPSIPPPSPKQGPMTNLMILEAPGGRGVTHPTTILCGNMAPNQAVSFHWRRPNPFVAKRSLKCNQLCYIRVIKWVHFALPPQWRGLPPLCWWLPP